MYNNYLALAEDTLNSCRKLASVSMLYQRTVGWFKKIFKGLMKTPCYGVFSLIRNTTYKLKKVSNNVSDKTIYTETSI